MIDQKETNFRYSLYQLPKFWWDFILRGPQKIYFLVKKGQTEVQNSSADCSLIADIFQHIYFFFYCIALFNEQFQHLDNSKKSYGVNK
jgi:hypothetical protein